MVVYFDYSSESDIPVLLENWQRYKLMQDIHSFIPTVVDYMSPKEGVDLCKNGHHERVYIDTLSEKITAARKYMTENPDWFHENLQALLPSAVSESGQRSEISSSQHTSAAPLRGSQQLEMVTVEHNRTLSESDRDTDIDVTDSQTSKHSSNPRRRQDKPPITRTVTPPPLPISMSKSQSMSPALRTKTKVESGISSLDSYSSSLEDLEHDINFILNPSLPAKTMTYTSSAQGLIDILPHINHRGVTTTPDSMLKSNGLILTVPSVSHQLPTITACSTVDDKTSTLLKWETTTPQLTRQKSDQNTAQEIIVSSTVS